MQIKKGLQLPASLSTCPSVTPQTCHLTTVMNLRRVLHFSEQLFTLLGLTFKLLLNIQNQEFYQLLNIGQAIHGAIQLKLGLNFCSYKWGPTSQNRYLL